MAVVKNLAVFDFDHTILDDNSDTAIFSLTDKNSIPKDIKRVQYSQGWTSFMQAMFTYLHNNGIKSSQIQEIVKTLPPVDGFLNLIKNLHKSNKYDLIIISDSNSIFIESWLHEQGIRDCFERIYTNPAVIENDCFYISPYHNQECCKLSTKNLCKGQVLEEFLNSKRENGIIYEKVVYIGDGVNDLCPILRLRENDVACARRSYKLADLVEKTRQGKCLDKTGQIHAIKAEICIWTNGDDILNHLQIK